MNRQSLLLELSRTMDTLRRAAVLQFCPSRPTKDAPTHTQLNLLSTLEQEGPQSIKALAECFRMTSSAATQLVDTLEQAGLAQRVSDTQDKRRLSVELTPLGKTKLDQANHQRLAAMGEAFQALTDQELLQFHSLHQKIVTHIQTVWNQPNPSNPSK